MISIQELVKKTGVSSRMLRYYDEKDLLHPVFRAEGGTRYYDESAIGAVSLIGSFLSLDYRLDDIREILSEESFSLEKYQKVIKNQQQELILQKERIDRRLEILRKLQESDASVLTSWKEVEEKIHQIMSELKIKETHQDPNLLLHNSWCRQGSNFEEWMRFMFEPVTFHKAVMKMAEVNASNGFYWLYNQERLPKGELDLFYDANVRIGKEQLQKDGLKTTWKDSMVLADVPDGTYDLVFNDHSHFYKEHVKEGFLQLHRILKGGGSLFLICEDISHNELFSKWKNYIDPSRIYRNQYFKEHYTSDVLLPLLASVFENVSDYPRRNVVQITDEDEILFSLENECKLERSDHAGKLRFEAVKKEVHSLIEKQGYVERVSFYHVLKAEKTA